MQCEKTWGALAHSFSFERCTIYLIKSCARLTVAEFSQWLCLVSTMEEEGEEEEGEEDEE